MTTDKLLGLLNKVRGHHPHFIACCPAHDDRHPSLSVTDAGDKTLVHCFAGCSPAEIIASLGLTLADLFSRNDSWEISRRIERVKFLTLRFKREGKYPREILKIMKTMDALLPQRSIELAIMEAWGGEQ